MKHRSQRIKPILTAMAITFVAVFFILSFKATARAAQPMVAAGWLHTVGLKSDNTVVAVGDNYDGTCNVSSWTDIVQVAAGWSHTVGLKSDGTVVAVGDNSWGRCNVSSWTDIVQVAAGCYHTVGVKSDGTVVAVGDNYDGTCNVSSWTDIVQVAAGWSHTVGLKSDGTVVAVGDNSWGRCNVSSWEDIVQVAAGCYHTVGVKSDGTVVAVGDNYDGTCNVSSWTDIVQVAAGEVHTVGVKSDGTAVAVGWTDSGQCNVSSWTDIVQVAAGSGFGYYHTVGLKSDGTVVAVGSNYSGQCNVSSWEDIVQVAAGGYHTVGVKSDGTVVAVGYNGNGQCNVSSWTDIVQVAAARLRTVGVKSDGTVVAVGSNSYGQCDVFDWNLGTGTVSICEPNLPIIIKLTSAIKSIKEFATGIVNNKWQEVLKLYDPLVSDEEKQEILKQLVDDGINLYTRKFAADAVIDLYCYVTNLINETGNVTYTRVPEGTLVTYSSGYQCVVPGIYLPFDELRITSKIGCLEFSYKIEALTDSFTIQTFRDDWGIGLGASYSWDFGDISTSVLTELYVPTIAYIPTLAPGPGLHSEITIDHPGAEVILTINDPWPTSLRHADAKVAGYIGRGLPGIDLSFDVEAYAKTPFLSLDPIQFPLCIGGCIQENTGGAEDVVKWGIDQFSCMVNCTAVDRVGVGIGATLGDFVIEAGLRASEKLETSPQHVNELISNGPDLASFLFHSNYVLMTTGKVLSLSEIWSLPFDLWNIWDPFWTAHRMAEKLRDPEDGLSLACRKDTIVKGYLGIVAGLDFSIFGAGGEVAGGVETNLETLLSAFTFDIISILNNGYGGGSIKEVAGVSAGPVVAGVKLGTLKNILKLTAQMKGGTTGPLSIAANNNINVSGLSDSGLDTDSDGLYNLLRVEGILDVDTEGNYGIGGMLYKGDICVGYTNTQLYLSPGSHNISLDFQGLHLRNMQVDGPYTFGALVAKEGEQTPVFLCNSLYTTSSYSYSSFDTPSADIVSAVYAGVDDNADGLYDSLRATLTLNSDEAMEVTIRGTSTDRGLSLASSATASIPSGTSQVDLLFDGKEIRKSGLDAPYNLEFTVYDDRNEPHDIMDDSVGGFLYTNFQLPEISLSNVYTDQAIDTDLDGYFDELNLGVGIIVTQPETYTLEAVLEGENASFYLSKRQLLTASDHTVTFSVEGIKIRNTGINQTYDLKYLRLYDDSGNIYGSRQHACTTAWYNFTDFEPAKISLTDQYRDQGVDTDSNNLYNYLNIDVGVYVREAGIYRITGHLKCGESYVSAKTTLHLDPGQNTVSLRFDGPTIYSKKYSGTYELEMVGITADDQYVDYHAGVCHTCDYDYQDFEHLCESGDANGDGSINVQDVICIINCILDPAFSPAGNPDCNEDGNVNVQDVICVINKILGG